MFVTGERRGVNRKLSDGECINPFAVKSVHRTIDKHKLLKLIIAMSNNNVLAVLRSIIRSTMKSTL